MNKTFSGKLITVDELWEILIIGKSTAYRLLNAGGIKCFKINREWKIPRSSVYEYIQC
ncbi:helix-turn-helix domain-containing protein [Megasphaera stantonii]|jgi:excisionase family DNA binding protein|uniref:helix-turn-helix domain-containing protein n=1 Tax=Megasphaera stantonii TaxID=2144175 RepID=UPI003D18A095